MSLARKKRPSNFILSSDVCKIKRFASCTFIKELVTSHSHLQYFTPMSLSSMSLVADIAEAVVLV